jgi:hypothetical protein
MAKSSSDANCNRLGCQIGNQQGRVERQIRKQLLALLHTTVGKASAPSLSQKIIIQKLTLPEAFLKDSGELIPKQSKITSAL